MIRINLLPAEKRRKEKTPLPRVGLVFLDAVAFAAAIFACLWYVVWINGEVRDRDEIRSRRESLQSRVDLYNKLTGDVRSLESALTDIKGTANRNVIWWSAMDSIWEVVQANPKVWLDEISVMDEKAAEAAAKTWNPEFRGQPPFGLLLRAHCSGRDVLALTKFRKDLKERPDVKRWFDSINWDVQYSLAEERDSLEGWSMEFDIRLLGRKQVLDVTGAR